MVIEGTCAGFIDRVKAMAAEKGGLKGFVYMDGLCGEETGFVEELIMGRNTTRVCGAWRESMTLRICFISTGERFSSLVGSSRTVL